MTPIVLIATDKRVEITTWNIESLLRQSVKPKIVLVITDRHEYEKYKSLDYQNIFIEFENNKPLGNKWQAGVTQAKEQGANPLIITGSDDILGDGFIENACRLVKEGNHFVGIRRWWQHKEGRAVYCQYRAKDNFPLGGARIYSAELLNVINYDVFDPTADKHLDNRGWDRARMSGLKCLVLEDPEKEGLSIHAIKGNWSVMNPFTLNHPNLKVLRHDKSEKVLPSFYNHAPTRVL
jgi:hypothetical protein